MNLKRTRWKGLLRLTDKDFEHVFGNSNYNRNNR